MSTQLKKPRICDGDQLMQKTDGEAADMIILFPDAMPSEIPDPKRKLRIMWSQHLLEDLLAGRYRSLVCAVNPEDNSHGLISQLAELLPTSQWSEEPITECARQFSSGPAMVKVLKFDMDAVEVLAIP